MGAMFDYIYDGSFEGLLTVIWHHYYTAQAAGIYTEDRYQPSFLQGSMEVEAEDQKADRVYQAIRQKISVYDLRCVYRAWLSCDPEKEMKILRYLVLGFKEQHRTSSLHGHPAVAAFQDILKKIAREEERMLQFVRFSVVSLKDGDRPREFLYARIEPDNDVIELSARHFSDRFRNDPFIIHDVKRGKAIFAYGGKWIVTAFAPEEAPKPSEEEMGFRRLWKSYFDHIAILERTNRRCQNHFIPDRYRGQLTEIITMAEERDGDKPLRP